jgi:hypothetical protein
MVAKKRSTMAYYKSPAGKASYKKKLAADVKRSTSPSGLAKRAELKRKRNEAIKKHGAASVKGNDVSHTKNGTVLKKSSVNRGSKTDTAGDKRARGKKK